MSTKDQILDSAERLFAEHGVAATSLRGILAEAGLNPASIHYHFGGKEALVQAVLARRLEPMNTERARQFDALEARAAPAFTTAEVVEAYVGPALRLQASREFDGKGFLRLLGRTYAEAESPMRDHLMAQVRPTVERFASLVARSLPDIDPRTCAWRVHFAIGAMAHTLSCGDPVGWLDAEAGDEDLETVVSRLVEFLAGGLSAPCPPRPEVRR